MQQQFGIGRPTSIKGRQMEREEQIFPLRLSGNDIGISSVVRAHHSFSSSRALEVGRITL